MTNLSFHFFFVWVFSHVFKANNHEFEVLILSKLSFKVNKTKKTKKKKKKNPHFRPYSLRESLNSQAKDSEYKKVLKEGDYWVLREYTPSLLHRGGSYPPWSPLSCKREEIYSRSI